MAPNLQGAGDEGAQHRAEGRSPPHAGPAEPQGMTGPLGCHGALLASVDRVAPSQVHNLALALAKLHMVVDCTAA